MSNIDHYNKAEELLTRFDNMTLIDKGRYGYVLTQAQIHATLATARQGRLEYVIDIDDLKKEASKI